MMTANLEQLLPLFDALGVLNLHWYETSCYSFNLMDLKHVFYSIFNKQNIVLYNSYNKRYEKIHRNFLTRASM